MDRPIFRMARLRSLQMFGMLDVKGRDGSKVGNGDEGNSKIRRQSDHSFPWKPIVESLNTVGPLLEFPPLSGVALWPDAADEVDRGLTVTA